MAEGDNARQGMERQKMLYWNKLVELKTAANYIEGYRNWLGGWVTGVAVVRAIASSTSIAGWVIWREYAFVWASIIAVSQVLDALREVFPFARRHKAAAELASHLNRLFIDAQLEWENILANDSDEEEVAQELHSLRVLHHNAEAESFGGGLTIRRRIFRVAEARSKVFFVRTYGVHLKESGGKRGELAEETGIDG